jgi:uncharacterized integral membrane protein
MASTHTLDSTTTRRSRVDMAKAAVAAVLLVLLVLFGVVNADDVPVDVLVTTADLPLILVIAASALAGAVVSAFVRHRRS